MCFSSLTAERYGQGTDVKGGRSPFILTLDLGFVRTTRGHIAPYGSVRRTRSRTIHCAFRGDWGIVPNKHFL